MGFSVKVNEPCRIKVSTLLCLLSFMMRLQWEHTIHDCVYLKHKYFISWWTNKFWSSHPHQQLMSWYLVWLSPVHSFIFVTSLSQNESHFNTVLSFSENKIHIRELLPAPHNVPDGPFLPIYQPSHDPVAAQHGWWRCWRAGPGRAKSQSQPFSLIMWASSMMNFPSLYFWLDSNACSWNSNSIFSKCFNQLH